MSGTFLPVEGEEKACRESFHHLTNARENPSALALALEWLSDCLAGANLTHAPLSPENLQCDAGLAPSQRTSNKASFALPPGFETDSSWLLAFHAPVGLLEGAWLQALAQPGNGHCPQTGKLFAVYLALLGKDEADSPAFAYRGWLDCAGVSLPKPQSWPFAQDPRIGAAALRFANLQLALGHQSANCFPEALGFTLAYLCSASPWRLPALPAAQREARLEAMASHALSAVQAYLGEAGDWDRVRRGYALYAQAELDYLESMRHAEIGPSLAEQVADIFRRKRGFAQGYHREVKLGGRGLEAWLADEPFDAAVFLAAFATSPYAQGKTGLRPFDRLNAFGGPMFGVFDRDEMGLIDAWLDSGTELPQSGPQHTGNSHCVGKPLDVGRTSVAHPASKPDSVRRNLFCFESINRRNLFHSLINQDPRQPTQDQARRWVETMLARARRRLSGKGSVPKRFFGYTHQAFAERVAHIHAEEVAKHRPFQPPPKLRREDYLSGIIQLAPAILVDGCWLRHQGEAANQDSRLHRLLYRIYAEELGEGREEWNHPKIYRDLLESLDIALPATDSEAFAQHPAFLDSAFDLPDYLLGISLFPNTYLPETLGLNLAIELSGLGAGYLRLAEELKYWDINPLIVSLHLSIDNLAGGHSAMACEAIQLYLEEIRLLGGEEAMQAAWRRVWSGYLSLDAATRRFKWGLLFAFCRRLLPQGCRRSR